MRKKMRKSGHFLVTKVGQDQRSAGHRLKYVDREPSMYSIVGVVVTWIVASTNSIRPGFNSRTMHFFCLARVFDLSSNQSNQLRIMGKRGQVVVSVQARTPARHSELTSPRLSRPLRRHA